MQARKLIARVEADEAVSAVYARDLGEVPDELVLRMGALVLIGRPQVVIDALNRAARECWEAWVTGVHGVAGDGPSATAGNTEKVTALPPMVDQPVVGDAGSRIGPWADSRRLLVLDAGAAAADPLQFSGGGIRQSFYLIRGESERDG